MGIPHFFETSAKEKTGVEDAFMCISRMALENVQEAEPYIGGSMIVPERLATNNVGGRKGCC